MQIEAAHNITTSQIVGAAIEVHRILGPGLLESTYTECLKIEFDERELRYVSELSIPIVYSCHRSEIRRHGASSARSAGAYLSEIAGMPAGAPNQLQ